MKHYFKDLFMIARLNQHICSQSVRDYCLLRANQDATNDDGAFERSNSTPLRVNVYG
jgi:hypothetical protein